MAEGEILQFLREDSPRPAELTAPPSGLFLERVYYEGDSRDYPLRPVLNLGDPRPQGRRALEP
jgi:hypothetical protein